MLSTTTPNKLHALRALADKHNKRVVAFDLETTGLDFHSPEFRIIEVGLIAVNPDGRVTTSADFVSPDGVLVTEFISSLTGIDNTMVATARTWDQFWGPSGDCSRLYHDRV